jgi:hypothetical protein
MAVSRESKRRGWPIAFAIANCDYYYATATGSHSGRVTNESSDHGSDASWSIAGGSDVSDDEDYPSREPPTPQLRPVRTNGELLRRDDTIRGRKKL